jgi:hypothetical protein
MKTVDEYVATLTEDEKVTFAPMIKECKEREEMLKKLPKTKFDLLKELDILNEKAAKIHKDIQDVNKTLDRTCENLKLVYLNKIKSRGSC